MSPLVASALSIGALAAPVAVGLGAAAIVLAAQLGVLSTIPASVCGFASMAGLILLKGLSPVEALAPTAASIILGAAFGWVSERVAGKLTKVTVAPASNAAAAR